MSFFFIRNYNYYIINEKYVCISLDTPYKRSDYFSTKYFQYFLLIRVAQWDARHLSDCRSSTTSHELNGLVQS